MTKAGERLDAATLSANFADWPPPLGDDEAVIEAARCLFCYDAPCTRACPTHIDIPKFIRQIMHGVPVAAAKTILDENIFGGSCARACPTEVLCEGACVDNTLMKAPVEIGRLQRHACDTARAKDARFYTPGDPTGKSVAIIGAGPAGLTCAHELRKHGHATVVYEARDIAGGLNTLGIAAYKISTEFAMTEIAQIERLGVDVRLNHRVDADELAKLLDAHDAVFLGIGLGQTYNLGIPGENAGGAWEALDFIFQTHTLPFEACEIGRRVLVIGGGNTAVDVATAAVRLGAESVTIAYRRGKDAMPAFAYEYDLTKKDGIQWLWNAKPTRFVEEDGAVTSVEFVRTEVETPGSRSAKLVDVQGSAFTVEADMVVKALGQTPLTDLVAALPGIAIERGRVVVDRATGRTGVEKLWAGGDCISKGAEIVDAVQEGKLAARAINATLLGNDG